MEASYEVYQEEKHAGRGRTAVHTAVTLDVHDQAYGIIAAIFPGFAYLVVYCGLICRSGGNAWSWERPDTKNHHQTGVFDGNYCHFSGFCVAHFQYLSIEYGVTNKRLIMKKGVIRLFVAEIPTDRIESIYCYQGLLGRIFRYGTLSISGIGGTLPVFKMVHRPYALRRKIVDIIEKNKTITVVHGALPKAAPPIPKPEPVAQEEPIYRYGTFVRVLPGN